MRGKKQSVSPSHEALLPNVGLEKVLAMSKSAKSRIYLPVQVLNFRVASPVF